VRTIDQTTREILELAAKHFNVPAGTLAPDDDFFKKLGIDSLQTLELLSRPSNFSAASKITSTSSYPITKSKG